MKDLLDMVLIATHMSMSAASLRAAVQATFAARELAALPQVLPPPPATWAAKYRRLAQEVGLAESGLAEAFGQARRFLDPVLSDRARGIWLPDAQRWDDAENK